MLHGLYLHGARVRGLSLLACRAPSTAATLTSTFGTRRRGLLTLAIETSCDDTCVAILEKQSRLDRNGIATRDNSRHAPGERPRPLATLHFNDKVTARSTGKGGIHPLEALDSHRTHLAALVNRSLRDLPPPARDENQSVIVADGQSRRRPDFITVTRGPGMRSNLSCGLDLAKGLSVAWQVPLLGVHHMQAHALTPRMEHALQTVNDPDGIDSPTLACPAFPFLTLLVSGGHTMLVHSRGLIQHEILASTADIAVGDALDKAGRAILPESWKRDRPDNAFAKYLSHFAFPADCDFNEYPVPKQRGDEIEKPANEYGWQLQAPFSNTRQMAFSFAGMSTAINNILAARPTMDDNERLVLARTALGIAFEHLGSRTIMALENLRAQHIEIPSLVVSGGVAANKFLRYFLCAMLAARNFGGVQLIFPQTDFCTDNAAMIAWTGLEMFEAGYQSESGIHALRRWSMDDSEDGNGGILGAGGWIKL